MPMPIDSSNLIPRGTRNSKWVGRQAINGTDLGIARIELSRVSGREERGHPKRSREIEKRSLKAVMLCHSEKFVIGEVVTEKFDQSPPDLL